MMSFAAFKHHVLDAFSGEPVVVSVSRTEQRWSLNLKSFDERIGLSVGATAETCPTPAAVRALCVEAYKSLVEEHAEYSKEVADLERNDEHFAPDPGVENSIH